MAKNAKLTIYHTRSIQTKVKYSILPLQDRLKKLLYFHKVCVCGGNNADDQSFDP